MAGITDILTSAQNIVTALSGLRQIIQYGQGTNTSATVTASTLVTTGSGRLVNYSITVKGLTGTIHDAATVATATAANALCATPNYPGYTADSPLVPTGVFPVGALFMNGLVIKPGTGQSVNVTYSLG